MKRLAAAALLLLLAVIVVRALIARPQEKVESKQMPAIDRQAAVQRLVSAIRVETISSSTATGPSPTFEAMARFLDESFPKVREALRHERVGARNHLYVWEGTDPSLAPILLLAHLDVVPVEPSSRAAWTSPPFDGAIKDGFIYGRGALDDKASAVAIMESIERLLERGFRPKRSVYVAFGGDEEVLGLHGAGVLAGLLESRGIKPLFVLDEGSAVIQGMVPGVERPLALIGIAEKGFLNLELVARAPGGHSSSPPDQTTIGILSAAIERLERNPFPRRPNHPARLMASEVAGDVPFFPRLLYANVWLFRPLIDLLLMQKPVSRASLRTTTAVTMIHGGVKDNVLPTEAKATVNLRIIPGETRETVAEHVREVIDDARIEVKTSSSPGSDPVPESSIESPGYRAIARAVKEVIPDAIVAPSLVIGATDSRYYRRLSADIYRFAPLRLTPKDITRVHGVDERIGVDQYIDVVRFYARLIEDAGG
jgi:carboxypeptidase PM20D1